MLIAVYIYFRSVRSQSIFVKVKHVGREVLAACANKGQCGCLFGGNTAMATEGWLAADVDCTSNGAQAVPWYRCGPTELQGGMIFTCLGCWRCFTNSSVCGTAALSTFTTRSVHNMEWGNWVVKGEIDLFV